MQVLHITQRQAFIRDLFLQCRNLRYAFLKYFYPTQYDIPESSDLDILIDPQEIKEWKRIIQDANHIKSVSFREKSFALFVEICLDEGGYLEIDLIYACKWKFNVFLQREEVLDAAKLNLEGIKIASLVHSYAYLSLFYTLNNCPVPDKYQEFYQSLTPRKQQEIRKYLIQKYQLKELGEDLFELTPHKEQMVQRIRRFSENQGWSGWVLTARAIRDRLKDPGITITFSGVDGAGKSTILEKTRQLLSQKYRQEVVLLRQRPSLLPILSAYKYGKQAAEQKAANTLPRTGTNQSKISSFIRFIYYYSDYLFGQFYIYFKYNLKGHIVLYDRYYFDYINDSKRANIVLSSNFIRSLYRFVFKPELNFLLYADPEIILARKQELSKGEIVELTEGFKNLFALFNQRYSKSKHIPINNLDIEETLQIIEQAYLESKN